MLLHHCNNVEIKRLIASTLCQLVALSLMRINASSPWCKYKRHEDSLAHRPEIMMLCSGTFMLNKAVAPPLRKLCERNAMCANPNAAEVFAIQLRARAYDT